MYTVCNFEQALLRSVSSILVDFFFLLSFISPRSFHSYISSIAITLGESVKWGNNRRIFGGTWTSGVEDREGILPRPSLNGDGYSCCSIDPSSQPAGQQIPIGNTRSLPDLAHFQSDQEDHSSSTPFSNVSPAELIFHPLVSVHHRVRPPFFFVRNPFSSLLRTKTKEMKLPSLLTFILYLVALSYPLVSPFLRARIASSF